MTRVPLSLRERAEDVVPDEDRRRASVPLFEVVVLRRRTLLPSELRFVSRVVRARPADPLLREPERVTPLEPDRVAASFPAAVPPVRVTPRGITPFVLVPLVAVRSYPRLTPDLSTREPLPAKERLGCMKRLLLPSLYFGEW